MNTHCMLSFLLIFNVYHSLHRHSLPSFATSAVDAIITNHCPIASAQRVMVMNGNDHYHSKTLEAKGPRQWNKKDNNIYANDVKKSSTWGQSAWITTNSNNNPSETTRSASQISQSYAFKDNTKKSFYQWLVGVTDGDGTFHFSKTKKGI